MNSNLLILIIKWAKAQNWFEECDVFVFIGTSFSVGVTAEALAVAEKDKKIVYNFNIHEEEFNCEHYNVIGKSIYEF